MRKGERKETFDERSVRNLPHPKHYAIRYSLLGGARTPLKLVGLSRFELLTPRLSSVCSNQLSYRPSKPKRATGPPDRPGSLKTR